MPTTTTAATEDTALLLAGSRTADEARQRRGVEDGVVDIRHDDDDDSSPSTNDQEGRIGGALDRKVWLMRFFTVVSVAASLASAVLLVSQVASVTIVVPTMGPVQALLRAYVIIVCLMFLMSELQVELFLRRAESYRSWVHRGFMYTWVGVVGMEESVSALGQAYPDHPAPTDLVVSVLLRASSLAMFGVGTVYVLMGALCLRPVWENLRQQQQLPQQP